MHPQCRRKYSVIITLWQCESLFSIRTAISKLSWSKSLFFRLITAILNFFLEQTSNYISNFLTFIVIVITFYLPSYLGQKTAKWLFGLRVKLPPVYRTRWRLHTIPLFAERQSGKLWISIFIVFGLTRPGIEPESTASVADALSTRPPIGKYLLIFKKCYSSSKLKIKGLGDLFNGLPRG